MTEPAARRRTFRTDEGEFEVIAQHRADGSWTVTVEAGGAPIGSRYTVEPIVASDYAVFTGGELVEDVMQLAENHIRSHYRRTTRPDVPALAVSVNTEPETFIQRIAEGPRSMEGWRLEVPPADFSKLPMLNVYPVDSNSRDAVLVVQIVAEPDGALRINPRHRVFDQGGKETTEDVIAQVREALRPFFGAYADRHGHRPQVTVL